MLNLLIIAYPFSPNSSAGSKRFSFLSRLFVQHSVDVHILTVTEKCIDVLDNSYSGDGHISRVPAVPRWPFHNRSNLLFRTLARTWVRFSYIDPFAGWIPFAISKGIKIVKKQKINLILVTGPPFSQFTVAQHIAKHTGIPLVLDYRDPWTSFKWQEGNRRNDQQFHEESVLKTANGAVFVTGSMLEDFCHFFPDSDKTRLSVITNGYHCEEISPISLNSNTFNITYAGGFYGQRNLRVLKNPIAKLQASINKPVRIHVFGRVTEKDKLAFSEYGYQNMLMEHKRVTRDILLRYLASSDVLYLPSCNDVPYALPYKLYDYITVKRPILALGPEDSQLSRFFRERNCGEFANIDIENDIFSALARIASKQKEYNYIYQDLLWSSISKIYLDYLNNILLLPSNSIIK